MCANMFAFHTAVSIRRESLPNMVCFKGGGAVAGATAGVNAYTRCADASLPNASHLLLLDTGLLV